MRVKPIQRFHHSDLAYSQCWEDPDTVRSALQITPGDDVLAVTSGGCNVLALLLNQPRSLTAVDINPAQNYLLELKRGALLSLSHANLLTFVGARQSGDRWALYHRLREHLSGAAQSYWDLRQDDIEPGVIHTGRFERYLNLFRKLVLPLIHPKEKVEELLRPKSLNDQALFYDREWDTFKWRALFRLFFSRCLLSRFGRYKGAFRYVDTPDVSAHYLERVRHAMKELPVASNYFLQYMTAGNYQTSAPLYLDAQYQEALKLQAKRLRIVTADLRSFLKAAPPRTFSKFYLSDVFEFFSMEDYEAALSQIVRVARPGARLYYYNNLVRRSHPESLEALIQSEDDLAQRLHWQDRAFVYRSVVVERVIK